MRHSSFLQPELQIVNLPYL